MVISNTVSSAQRFPSGQEWESVALIVELAVGVGGFTFSRLFPAQLLVMLVLAVFLQVRRVGEDADAEVALHLEGIVFGGLQRNEAKKQPHYLTYIPTVLTIDTEAFWIWLNNFEPVKSSTNSNTTFFLNKHNKLSLMAGKL